MAFSELCDSLFEGIDRHLTIDGGIVVELLLDYLCNEGCGDDEDSRMSKKQKVQQVICDRVLFIYFWLEWE